MKAQLISIVAAVLFVGCGPSVDIHEAVSDGNIKAVKQHLDAGTDVNARQEFSFTGARLDWTPLHNAAFGRKEIAELLIAKGADVNARSSFEETPLYFAALMGQKEIVELLIAAGTDVNAKNKISWTPLHQAARLGHKEIAVLLIAAGADVNAKADNGLTPLDHAVISGHSDEETANLLRKHGGKTGEELKAQGK